ncbi:hypothetical protein [Glycomyces algeriensis]|uniref:Neocarzinostatin family protein n=1 Tax=Glycomyces algeriensis TaxID=256037 RepID=A0A9W6GDM4_9ACTN|nr:hypothetical protein [Glycomyces algeriensis]MDA1368560.1 hypothetical protein [Glycomyces algeriensis]MDR7352359.1 opacity protein-like surface antigen [Glycomyces algeriensis]GLI45096.1 hypothetical protein GALLR39Z86_49460 [Glycomyces algeriensis]
MPHRRPATLAAAAALLLCTAASATTAAATQNYVDIVLTEGDSRCTAERVKVVAAPPGSVAIHGKAVGFDCSGSTRFAFAGDAVFAFDDANGTATAEDVRIAATKIGVTCTYEASRVTLKRDGASREYRGGPIRAGKAGGSFLCPDAVNLDSAEVVFHR